MLFESLFILLRNNFFFIFLTPLWLLKGKQVLKNEIYKRIEFSPENLPYNQEVIEFIKINRNNYSKTALVSASNQNIVKDIAEYISDPRKKMFVCLLDSKLVGALFAEYHSTYVHLESLIVEKQFQKKGIGTQLFDHFENDISKSNIPLIEVLTEQNNSVMMKLLENRGFRKGNTFVFYSKGE